MVLALALAFLLVGCCRLSLAVGACGGSIVGVWFVVGVTSLVDLMY